MVSRLKSFGRPAALVLGALAFAALTVNALRSDQGPNPVTDLGAWTDWAARDPVNALVMLVSALLAGIGAWGTVANLLQPNASRDDLARATAQTGDTVRQADAASAGRDAALVAHLTRLEAKIEELSGSSDAAGRTTVAETLAAIAASEGEASRSAREALATDDPRAVIKALMSTQGEARAASLMKAGALAQGFDIATAIDAYEEALALAPDYDAAAALGRLQGEMGRTEASIVAYERAAELAEDDMMRAEAKTFAATAAVGHDNARAARLLAEAEALLAGYDTDGGHAYASQRLARLLLIKGDLANNQGRIDEARTAYEASIRLTEKLVKANPDEEWMKRDLFVIHERFGNMADRQGDRPAVRAARETGVLLASEMLERAPATAQAQWDMSIAHDLLGESLLKDRETEKARAAYSRAVAIRQSLHERDTNNLEWLTGLITSLRREGVALLALDRLDEAAAVAMRLIPLSRRLEDRSPGAGASSRNLQFQARLARELAAAGKADMARLLADSALDLQAALLREGGGAGAVVGPLADVVMAYRGLRDRTAEREVLAAARTIVIERRAAEPEAPMWAKQWALFNGLAAETEEQAGAWQAAGDRYAEAQSAYLTLATLDPAEADEARRLAALCDEAGRAARARA